MKRFVVRAVEVHNCYVEIVAETSEEAIASVAEGEGILLDTEYSYTLGPDRWDIECVKELQL